MTMVGTTISCDCCGEHKLAQIDSHGLEIKNKSHGRRYTATVPPTELLQKLAGTLEGSAIVQFVRGVFTT